MSTRAMYTFKDQDKVIHVYKHCDNYPDTVHGGVSSINKAKEFAWGLPRFEPSDFAAAFVAANKGNSGGSVRLCGTSVKEPWDFSVDSEYWYVVTSSGNELNIEIYTVSWWDNPREETLIFSGTFKKAVDEYI